MHIELQRKNPSPFPEPNMFGYFSKVHQERRAITAFRAQVVDLSIPQQQKSG
jgi:hypothetical protein